MNCRTIERYLSAYLDGEMVSSLRDAFFDHLTECEGCRDRVGEATYQEAALALALKRRMTAPAAIRYNVLSAISRENAAPARSHRGFAWRPAAAMAAMLALGSAGWRTFTQVIQPDAAATETRSAPQRIASVPPSTAPRPTIKPAPERASEAVKTPASAAPVNLSVEKRVGQAMTDTGRLERPAPPRLAAGPAKPPAAAPMPDAVKAPVAPETPVGKVTAISTPGESVIARFMARREGKSAWKDATANLHANTHLQSGDDTIVTMALNDGTTLKSNQHTEFIVLRSPGRDDPSWSIRLVRGELWVKSANVVNVSTPSMDVHAENAEFSVRSMDGEDAAVMAVDGSVTARNARGAEDVSAGHATAATPDSAPEPAFQMANPKGQMDWAYAPEPSPAP
jgi:hypothetical protein